VAIERATKLAAELLDGTLPLQQQKLSAKLAVQQFLSFLGLEKRAPKTLVKYTGVLNRWCDHLDSVGVRYIHQIQPTHFDQYRLKRSQKTKSAKTIYNESVIIKGLLRWAKRRKLIRENALADIPLQKPRHIPKAGPSLTQVNAILANASGPDRPIFAMAAFTGARISDIRTRYLEDLDFAGNWVHFVSRPGAQTKGCHDRKVPLHARLREILQDLSKRKRQWLFTAAPSRKYPEGNHHISDKRLNARLKRVINSLGWKAGRDDGFTMHSLRRFFETHTVNAGIPQRVVDTWMGHHSDKSMAAIYYRLLDGDSQHFMAKVPFREEK